MEALRQNGFVFDTSFNKAYLGKTCCLTGYDRINDAYIINSIVEFPVTNFIDFRLFGYARRKPFNISAVSAYEMCAAIKNGFAEGPRHFVILLHSFSFVKTKDLQYRKTKPDYITINRFRKLCSFLGKNSDTFETLTFADYHKKYYKKDRNIMTNHNLPYVGLRGSFPRKVVQLVNGLL